MVEIFRTNVKSKLLAKKMVKTLKAHLPSYLFNFDLEDCDRILRAQTTGAIVETVKIIRIVKQEGIEIDIFED